MLGQVTGADVLIGDRHPFRVDQIGNSSASSEAVVCNDAIPSIRRHRHGWRSENRRGHGSVNSLGDRRMIRPKVDHGNGILGFDFAVV